MSVTAPTQIRVNRQSRTMELTWPDGHQHLLGAEYLRVHSPSAEVRGHGGGEGALVQGKQHVGIIEVEAIGHYAVRLVFDDGHNSGIYTWAYLAELGEQHDVRWAHYLQRLEKAGISRAL